MIDIKNVMGRSELLIGVDMQDLAVLMKDMAVRRKDYAKGEYVFLGGDKIDCIGVVLQGTVHIVQEDYWGNCNILRQVRPGGLFGEAFSCLGGAVSTVSVVAQEACELAFIDIGRIIRAGTVQPKAQAQIAANLLAIMARRNMELTEKIRYMSQRSMRKKLMFYLSDEARRQGSPTFSIPFTRQQLADYLSVNRSAMSAELGKMKKEGLISFSKERFTLLSRL